MSGEFTGKARKVLRFARDEAKRLNHDYIGTEHILLGLIRDEECIAATILENLGISIYAIKIEVLKLVKLCPNTMVSGNPPFTPSAESVIKFAIDEAKAMSHNYVGTEHLLLGLIKVEEYSISGKVLLSLGTVRGRVRQEIERLLDSISTAHKKLKERAEVKVEGVDGINELIAEEEALSEPLMKEAEKTAEGIVSMFKALYCQNIVMIKLLKELEDLGKGE